MLSWLLACAVADSPERGDDAPPASTEAEPRALDGCSYTMEWGTSSDGPWTCKGGFDAAGNPLGDTCTQKTGLLREWLSEWDDTGCRVGDHWYIEFDDGGSYEWIAAYRCDEQANEVWMGDRQIQLDPDGAVALDIVRETVTENTYDGDLLLTTYTTSTDGDTYESENTWSAEGWLAEIRYRTNADAWWVVTYERDDAGHVLTSTAGDEGEDPERAVTYTYDTLGREVRYELEASGRSDDYARTRAYEADTIRYVQDDYVYDDGDTARNTWTWSCP